jgi:heme oxygenase
LQLRVVEHLKRATVAEHRAVERAFDLKRRMSSLSAYRALLQQLWGLHCAWEQAAAPLIEPTLWADRRKSSWLHEDLRALGLSSDAIDRLALCAALPSLPTPSAALGAMYVIEGSTLGGQMIFRHAAATLDLTQACRGRFFYGYGPRSREMWLTFGDHLQTEYEQRRLLPEEAALGARAMFHSVTQWFSKPPQLGAAEKLRL